MKYQKPLLFFACLALSFGVLWGADNKEQNRLDAHKKLRKVINVIEENYVDEVQIDDVKLWALYINTFGKNDELLDKLQSRADFDVRAYLEKKNTGALEKVGNFLGMNKQPYFSASVLRKKYNNYKNACQKSYGDPLFRGKYNRLAQKLRTEAQDYVDAYAAGKFMLRPEDYQEFRNYIKIVCHLQLH